MLYIIYIYDIKIIFAINMYILVITNHPHISRYLQISPKITKSKLREMVFRDIRF